MIWLNCYEYQDKMVLLEELTSWILADCQDWCKDHRGSVYCMTPASYMHTAYLRCLAITGYYTMDEQLAIFSLVESQKNADLPG